MLDSNSSRGTIPMNFKHEYITYGEEILSEEDKKRIQRLKNLSSWMTVGKLSKWMNNNVS